MNNETRIEYVEGIPYEVRVHRNVEKRRAYRNAHPSVQQELSAVATSTIHSMERSPAAYSGITAESNFSWDGLKAKLGIADCPAADTSADGPGPTLASADGLNCYWTVPSWIEWFNNVTRASGHDVAVSKFAEFWDQRVTGEMEGNFSDDPTFNKFVKDNGLDSIPSVQQLYKNQQLQQNLTDAAEDTTAHLAKTVDNTAGILDKGSKTIQDTVSSGDKLIKWAPWIIGGVVLLFVGVIVYNLTVNSKAIIAKVPTL